MTALQHAGLRGYVDDDIHVSAVHHHNTERLPGVRIHKVIRRVEGELVDHRPAPHPSGGRGRPRGALGEPRTGRPLSSS